MEPSTKEIIMNGVKRDPVLMCEAHTDVRAVYIVCSHVLEGAPAHYVRKAKWNHPGEVRCDRTTHVVPSLHLRCSACGEAFIAQAVRDGVEVSTK
jgi:hypothetical protein